jgi:hypothetical protein
MNKIKLFGALGTGFVMILGFIVGIMMVVMTAMKGEPYQLSLQALEGDGRVRRIVGTPYEPGFFVTGKIQTSGSSGRATIDYKITGPEGSARVYVRARRDGEWTLTSLRVTPTSGGDALVIIKDSH